MDMQQLSENFTISDQISVDDVATIAQSGFTQIMCNRPDGEDPDQPSASDIALACATHGITFHHLPFQKTLSHATIEQFSNIAAVADGPIFAYCRSGQRSALLWKSATSQHNAAGKD